MAHVFATVDSSCRIILHMVVRNAIIPAQNALEIAVIHALPAVQIPF